MSSSEDKFFREIFNNIGNAAESFNKKDRSFNCVECGVRFTPREGQWIFYNLCDECFTQFDVQKMRGRLHRLSGEPIDYYESYEEYRKHNEDRKRDMG